MAKKTKSQLYRTLADAMADLMQQTAKQAGEVTPRVKRTRIVKPAPNSYQGAQRIFDSGQYQAIAPVQFEQSNVVAETLKDFHRSLDHMEHINGTRIPAWQESTMRRVIKQHPSAFNRTVAPVNPVYPTYTSTNFGVTDYFKPQQYRGIDNIDTMFEQAESMYTLDAPRTSRQFLSAGLKDVAAMARGLKPTSFKYKPYSDIVPKPVIEEIVTRRNAPVGTVEWLQKINANDPTNNAMWLDLFAKYPNYFKNMYDTDGKLIK